MKKLLSIFFIITILCLTYMNSWSQKVLFIAAGQSNAVGMGDSSLSVQVPRGAAFEYKYQSNELVQFKDPVGESRLNFEKAHTGSLWPSFADSYHSLTRKQVIIIPAARGGSSCNHKAELSNMGTWDSIGKKTLLDSAVKKAKAAEKLLQQKVDGIIWLQGERDANAIFDKQLTSREYEVSLKSVIERFRKSLGYNVPFYIVLTGNQRGHNPMGNNLVRQAQQKIAEEIPQVYIVYKNTNNFEKEHLMKDFVHYNQQALNQMGKEIARRIISFHSITE